MTEKQYQEEGTFVPVGYEHCPICDILVQSQCLVRHVRHGGCRLYKARERALIADGKQNCPCPICKESVNRKDLRAHLGTQHPV